MMPHTKFNVLCTVHHDIFVQQEPTGCTVLLSVYFDTSSIIRRYLSVYVAVGICYAENNRIM